MSQESFRQETLALDLEWQKRLITYYENKKGFYWSDLEADLTQLGTETQVIIESGHIDYIPVLLNKDYLAAKDDKPDLPSFLSSLPPGVNLSVRSRVAQIGLEARRLWILPESWYQEGEDGDKVKGVLEVANLGPRGIVINQGEGIARLFSTLNASRLEGQALQALLGNELKISGQEGTNWQWVGDNFQKQVTREQAVGIKFKVSSQRMRVDGQNNHPIAILANGIVDYRQVFNDQNILQAILSDNTDKENLWVSQTLASVDIGQGICGVMDPVVKIGDKYAHHLYSHLIPGGKTNWPIRVEVSEHGLNDSLDYDDVWVILYFYQENSNPRQT